MTQTSPPLVQIGDVLAGKYRVERILGQGAMGMVVAAMHADLHERRAIKFMLPTVLGDAEGVERFMREARACAKLKSKHVAAVYDVGRLEGGAPYIVMEYLEGTDLKEVLHQQKALSIPQAVDYMLQALEAVGEAHQVGIVHRDLKPANMFLASGVGGVPCIKVLDFGIAKLTSSPVMGPDLQDMTSTAAIMGSPLYMSPEQMKSSRYVDARGDIWSLGVILYRMVTGTLPFQAPTAPELFALILKDVPPPPSSVNPLIPKAFEAIIMKCLEKEAASRWNSAADLANALRPYTVEGVSKDVPTTEADGTTRHWRPPQASLPDDWYGAGSGAGSDSARRRAGGPPSAGSGVQGQTAPPILEGGTIPISGRPSPGRESNPLVQTGSNPAISSPTPVSYPPPSGSQPSMSPPRISYPGAGYDAGPPGQTSGSWSHTSEAARTRLSRGLAVAVALGGALFFAGVLILAFVVRSGGNAAPTTAPITVAEQPAPRVQQKPLEPPATQEPVAAPAVSVGDSTPPQSQAAPTSTQRAGVKATGPSTPISKPTKKPTQPNPFD